MQATIRTTFRESKNQAETFIVLEMRDEREYFTVPVSYTVCKQIVEITLWGLSARLPQQLMKSQSKHNI